MPTLYENYMVKDDTGHMILATAWLAQTFTPSISHIITSVKMKLYRKGDPGTLTVSIRATTDELPSGADLCVGTTDINDITTIKPGEWIETTFTTTTLLLAGTRYAIVARVLTTTPGNYATWRADGTYAEYIFGAKCWDAADSGATWTASPEGGNHTDMMFQELGELPGWTGKKGGVTNPAKVMGVDKTNIAKVMGVS